MGAYSGAYSSAYDRSDLLPIEIAITTHLKAHAGLASLVSTRIYPRRLPQNATYPAVTYFIVASDFLYRHGGAAGKASPRFQIDSWASTYLSACAVSEQVRLAMNGFQGTISAVFVDGAMCVNETDLIEPEIGIYHIAMDFEVTHTEAVA